MYIPYCFPWLRQASTAKPSTVHATRFKRLFKWKDRRLSAPSHHLAYHSEKNKALFKIIYIYICIYIYIYIHLLVIKHFFLRIHSICHVD